MLFILSNNIKISSHGLINDLISNGSHTIIFHIIQTFMLTHQLACINISFSNTHFKPFNSTITVLSFSHHSCSSCQATTYKQFHMAHFGPTSIRTVFNSLKPSSGLSVGSPLTKHRFHFVEPRIHGHFRPHTQPKPLSCLFKQGISK